MGLRRAAARVLEARGCVRDGWLPAGRALISALEQAAAAQFAEEGLEAAGPWPWSQRAAVLRAAQRTFARCGWRLVVEHERGPGVEACPHADLVTPRLRAGERLVLHAEGPGARWEAGVLEREGELARGPWWRPLVALQRLAEAGPWPGWLAPVQVEVAPLGAAELAAAEELAAELSAAGLRAALRAEGTLPRRVREAARRGVPGLVVLGPAELAHGRVALRWRGQRLDLARHALFAWLLAAVDSAAAGAGPTHLEPARPGGLASLETGPLPSPNPLQEN